MHRGMLHQIRRDEQPNARVGSRFVTDEVTDLLQHLIRNACVNDGTDTSGNEVRSADLLETYLEGERARL